jgi:predicted nucleotidyltransferase component of viral defense system
MLPTARELLRLAESTGYRVDTLEKVIRLVELLSEIDRHPLLGKSLVLKGGTALNLCFGRPQRLSVDLDFNFIGAADRQQMLETRPLVEQAAEAIGRSQGYAVQRSAESHASRKFYLSHRRSSDGLLDRLEVDVNYLHRVCLLPTQRRRVWRGGDEPGPEIALLSWPEIAAGKLVALLDRAATRDAWDVARLSSLSPEDWPPTDLRSVFIALAGTLPRPLYEYNQTRLERIRDEDVTRLLHPMLLPDDRPTAKELREASWTVLKPLLTLTEHEKEFCERLQMGELKPELIFPANSDLAEKASSHPALRWKAKNARAHFEQRGGNSR